MQLALTIIQVILCLVMVAVVMLQSGKSAGLSGAIAGGAETFLSKNKAKSLDAKLARGTKWVCAIWLVLTLALSLIPATINTEAPAASTEASTSISVEAATSTETEADASVEAATSTEAEADVSVEAATSTEAATSAE